MTAPALTLHRARSAAPFASRGALAAALGWWGEEAANQGEWLLVPRLRLVAPSPAHSFPGALARQLDRALGEVRDAATVDPAPGTWPKGALRFTRPERWLAWLAVRLATPDEAVPRECAPLPETPTVLKAQLRTTVAGEPRLLLALVRTLTAAGEFAAWAESWLPADVAVIREALSVHFAVPAPVLARLLDGGGETPFHTPGQTGPQPQSQRCGRQPSDSVSVAAARQILLASPPPLNFAALDPPRQSLARLLIALPAAPLLAPQLAEVLAPPATAPERVMRSYRRSSPEASHPIDQPVRARAAKRLPLKLQARRDHGQPVNSPAQPATPLAARRMREVLTDTPAFLPPAPPPPGRSWRPRHSEAPPIAQPALFETQFGGMMFLLNAFTVLGLYPDFTRPLDARIEPSPCWLLGQIGQHWFGRRFARDPLGKWLTGRAVAGDLPREWQIDPEWEDSSLRPLRFRLDGHACSWDRRGFLAKVAPLRPRDRGLPNPPLKLARKLRRLPLQMQPWLAGLISYLDWRLTAAGLSRADLCLPARFHWQDDGASLSMPLAELPLAIRLAGLDRDPGWLPAEGCNFRFEFA